MKNIKNLKSKINKKMKENKAITLVALVITVILLLILAGITISSLTGSGLFENAKLAEQKSKESQEKEDETLGSYENNIWEYVSGTRENSGLGYIDTSNKITSFDITANSNTYTASENCYITATLHLYGQQSMGIYINDIQISAFQNNNGGTILVPFNIAIAKGDTIKFVPTAYQGNMNVNIWKIK